MTVAPLRFSPSGPPFEILLTGSTFLRVTRYTTAAGAQSHVCGADADLAYIEGGAGGGAGGGANAGVGQTAVGGGSSAGGAFADLLTLDQGLSISFNVGAGGLGVLAGTGGNGSQTTAAYGSFTWTANGGLGSIASPASGSGGADPFFLGCVDGGTASSTSPTALLFKGGPGTPAIRETTSSGIGGNGGPSSKAPGGTGASSARSGNTSGNGQNGQLGSGGGGAINCNDNPAAGNTGGNGGTGYFFVWEFARATAA